jgi:UDP-N-acetylglucosamine acyltransferase
MARTSDIRHGFCIKYTHDSYKIIEAEMEATTERDEILQFIKNSHRGIMKGYFKSN